MLYSVIPENYGSLLALAGIIFAFAATVFATAKLADLLPKDGGREFAHDGKLSAGKPRGAGIIFVLAFAAAAFLFAPMKAETAIYLILTIICMMTGFLDDSSKMPWGEYKKGFLDLCVAALVAMTFLKYNSNTIELALFHVKVTIPAVLFAILIVILVWGSVNVTNCSDGVDGLSGTLTIITIMTIYVMMQILDKGQDFSFLILLFAVCILGYLALVLILDGGLGLVKVALLRFLKIRILKNTRTPLHDHVRKVWGWSNTQTVFRFAIIQIILAVAVIYGLQV